MEKESRRRIFRRSIRNFRHSSGLFSPITPAAEVVEEIINEDLASTYGSFWMENENHGINCDQPSADNIGILCSKVDVSVAGETCEEQSVLTSLSKLPDPTEEFLNRHQPLAHEECLTQAKTRDLTSSPVHDTGSGVVLWQQSCKQNIMDVNPNEVTPPQSNENSLPTDINYFHQDVFHEEISPVKEVFSGSQTGTNTVSTFMHNKMLEDDMNNKDNVFLLNENTRKINDEVLRNAECGMENQYKTVSCTTNSVNDKDVTDTLAGNIHVTDHNIKRWDMISLLSTRTRRQSDRPVSKPDRFTFSDSKPNSRKRLSLNKIQSNIFVERKSHIEKLEVNVDLDERMHMESKIHSQNNEKVDDVSSTPCTFETGNAWRLENQENINFIDCQINEDRFQKLEIAKDGLDFQKTAKEKKDKHRAKANRRSSRCFNLHEMPLIEFSCEENPDMRLKSPEIDDSVAKASLFTLSSSFDETGNKENVSDVQLDAKIQRLEEDSPTIFEKTIKLDNSHLKDCEYIEEVLDDFANLCVTEKIDTNTAQHTQQIKWKRSGRRRSRIFHAASANSNKDVEGEDLITELAQQINWKRSGRKHSGIFRTTSANIDSNKDVEDEDLITDTYTENDNLDMYSNSYRSSNFLVNSSNDTELRCDTDARETDDKSQDFSQFITDKVENEQSIPDQTISSVDVDMYELPSPDSISIKDDETQHTDSSHSKSNTRIRRSRKSWYMSQKSDSDIERKVPRRAGKQGKTEKQSVATLIPDTTQSSSSLIDATTTAQSSDGETTSEICTLQNDESCEYTVIAPGLVRLYQNKNYVKPNPRTWETIKESPKHGQPSFSKKQRKCFLEFESVVTRARLQRRHKKALDIYKKIELLPEFVTDEEFESKMLAIQLFVDDL